LSFHQPVLDGEGCEGWKVRLSKVTSLSRAAPAL
jgi:hypothetical protein